jgi:hypothetical protein
MEERHLEIQVERLQSDMQLVLEAVIGNRDATATEIVELRSEMNQRFDLVDLKFAAQSAKMEKLEQKLDSVATKLTEHCADPAAHKRLYTVHESEN